MIAIEGYSKWVEIIPLPGKEAKYTADALLKHVISRFGAMAEVVTDRGGEFEGEFQSLLEQCLVDHRRTSPSHPQANGMAERTVQSVKRSLAKMVEKADDPSDWEAQLAWVALGYNCSVQSSTGFSPYELLFAQKPVVPPAKREVLEGELDVLDEKALGLHLHERAQAHQQNCIMAMSGVEIAQRRDQLRYARLRSGEYSPRLRRFHVGDYVYVQQQKLDGLQMTVPRRVLRIKEIRDSGRLLVEGRDGQVMAISSVNASPCHLLGLDGRYDTRFDNTTGAETCQVCGSPYGENTMVMCEGCWTGWHIACLPEPLSKVPEGVWCCPDCTALGLTPEQLEQAQRQMDAQDEGLKRMQEQFTTAAKRQRLDDAKARLQDGQLCMRLLRDRRSGEDRWVHGRVHFRGGAARPLHFVLVLEGGRSEHCGMQHIEQWVREKTFRWLRRGAALPSGVRLHKPPPLLMKVTTF